MSNILWNTCLENLSNILDKQEITTWLKPLDAELDGKLLILYAPNKFVLSEVNKNLMQTIELVVKKIEPEFSVKIQLGVARVIFDKPKRKDNPADKFKSQLNPEFCFDDFVEGSSNQIASRSALGVANKPDGSFNPLLIYGSTGLGKSHLLHAIGNHIKKNQPKKTIVYQTAEQFVNEMVDAISKRNIDSFKKHYRGVDVLLVDDVQFIAGKDKSQEEFFHLFNNLLGSKSQVVLTCDKYPKDVDGLEERLKSRFGAGLSVAIEPPDLETRAAILRKKADLINFDLPSDVAFFIAEKVKSHVRDLEGALNSVFVMSEFTGETATIELTKKALRDLLSSQLRQISVENIQKVVADYYRIKTSDLRSKSRKASITKPRQLAMAIAKQLTSISLLDIGKEFNRDHATVIHAVKKVDEMKRNDPKIREEYTNLIITITS